MSNAETRSPSTTLSSNPKPNVVDCLPTELWHLIFRLVFPKPTLFALASTCRVLNVLATQFVFTTCNFDIGSKDLLISPEWTLPLLRALALAVVHPKKVVYHLACEIDAVSSDRHALQSMNGRLDRVKGCATHSLLCFITSLKSLKKLTLWLVERPYTVKGWESLIRNVLSQSVDKGCTTLKIHTPANELCEGGNVPSSIGGLHHRLGAAMSSSWGSLTPLQVCHISKYSEYLTSALLPVLNRSRLVELRFSQIHELGQWTALLSNLHLPHLQRFAVIGLSVSFDVVNKAPQIKGFLARHPSIVDLALCDFQAVSQTAIWPDPSKFLPSLKRIEISDDTCIVAKAPLPFEFRNLVYFKLHFKNPPSFKSLIRPFIAMDRCGNPITLELVCQRGAQRSTQCQHGTEADILDPLRPEWRAIWVETLVLDFDSALCTCGAIFDLLIVWFGTLPRLGTLTLTTSTLPTANYAAYSKRIFRRCKALKELRIVDRDTGNAVFSS